MIRSVIAVLFGLLTVLAFGMGYRNGKRDGENDPKHVGFVQIGDMSDGEQARVEGRMEWKRVVECVEGVKDYQWSLIKRAQ